MAADEENPRGSLRGIERAVDNMADRLVDLQGEVHADAERTKQVVREAVAEGIRDVLKDKEAIDTFWRGALDHLQQTATKNTGKFVLGSARALVARGTTFLLLGMLVYSIGGWTAVAKLWQSMFSN